MINMKGLSIIGVLLLAVGIIGVVLTYHSAFQKESISEKKMIADDQFKTIDIQTDNSTVEFIATDDSEPRAELTGKRLKNGTEKFTVDVTNHILSIKLADEQRELFSFDFFSPSLTLKVYVPEKQYHSLIVSNDNGKIFVNHVNADEINAVTSNGRLEFNEITGSKLNAKTSNGRIKLTGLEVKEVDVHSDNGTVELKQAAASIIRSETDNGKITMDDVNGEIVGKTNNGRISLSIHDLNQPLELESNNGRINVAAEKAPQNATFIVKTGNGKVNILNKYDGSTIIGNGDNVIKLTTDNGSITVVSDK
ncbi:DUF4097 family beta strand repeat-containing protein [Virgibacillus dakarensis]|uniref:DUF4097 family beta strand repeat-containing protein n=1 Tax=Virgibacillus dakarensis TaxID=1917889 RepID=UPI000B43DFFB|nr:DUF4097 family beta strand repeat-containing protein [Virgibacillus dakarensis]